MRCATRTQSQKVIIDPSWRQWQTEYEATVLHTSLFWLDLSMCAHMCEEVAFCLDCKGISGSYQVKSKRPPVHRQGLYRFASNFCIYVLEVIPGHGWNFSLIQRGRFFVKDCPPLKGFKGSHAPQVTFRVESVERGRERIVEFPTKRFGTFKYSNTSLVSKPSQPLGTPLETKHGRPCLGKNRPPPKLPIFKQCQGIVPTTKIKKFADNPIPPSRITSWVFLFPTPTPKKHSRIFALEKTRQDNDSRYTISLRNPQYLNLPQYPSLPQSPPLHNASPSPTPQLLIEVNGVRENNWQRKK